MTKAQLVQGEPYAPSVVGKSDERGLPVDVRVAGFIDSNVVCDVGAAPTQIRRVKKH